ncbi:MAG: hypothetical protein GXP33_07985 [Spirochaetes bacterium]|nr:hypothetical protein [Spirochaetota bacterium]
MEKLKQEKISDLPVKIVFTEIGVDWFIKHKKSLKRFHFADNTTEYGVKLENFSISLLRTMIHHSYISKIEISHIEFSSKHREIMDLSKMIVHDILYKQFDIEVFKTFINSSLIKRWNRMNPSKIIDENTTFNEFFVESMMQKNKDKIQQISKEIVTPILHEIEKSKDLTNKEKHVQADLSNLYLLHIRRLIWVFLSQFRNRKGYRTIIEEIRKALGDYLEKSKIAEYIGLMLMELATNAENVRFKKIAESIYPGNKNVENLIFSRQVREQVYAKLKERQDYLYLTWKLSGKSTSIGTENRLQIVLFNQEYNYTAIKKEIEDKTDIDLKEKSLFDFYEEIPGQKKDMKLGLYYLSYLQDACRKQNIRFDSYVGQLSGTDLTVITLNLQF